MITDPDINQALVECAYAIGDKSIASKKEPLVEARVDKTLNLFEAIGSSTAVPETEEISYVDGVSLKMKARVK